MARKTTTAPATIAADGSGPRSDAPPTTHRSPPVLRRGDPTPQRPSPAARRLILYSHERSDCLRLRGLFDVEFETDVVETQTEFSERLGLVRIDAAVLCFCSAQDSAVDVLARLVALAGPILTMACCRSFNPNFIHLAASRGVTQFLLCEMEEEAIRKSVSRIMRMGGLRELLESHCPGGLRSSPHMGKLVSDIVQTFPRRLTIDEASQRLGIKARRLQTLCREAFGRSFTHLLRLIWVHQALSAMQSTRLDNTEIALRLGYEDESSLARIFRKELGYTPSEARQRLAGRTPNELLQDRRPGA